MTLDQPPPLSPNGRAQGAKPHRRTQGLPARIIRIEHDRIQIYVEYKVDVNELTVTLSNHTCCSLSVEGRVKTLHQRFGLLGFTGLQFVGIVFNIHYFPSSIAQNKKLKKREKK